MLPTRFNVFIKLMVQPMINQLISKALEFVGTEMNDSFAAVALPSSLRCVGKQY
jgi:hypothetical protein